jgi:hypothetical protein
MDFYMSLFPLVLLCQLTNLFEIVVALLIVFWLKMKSGLFKCIFPTIGRAELLQNTATQAETCSRTAHD